jgi:hypothetical protein
MRLHAQTATIENGFVYVPKQAPWLPEYVIELTTLPKSKYDDQVDSNSQALAWIKTGMMGWAFSCGRSKRPKSCNTAAKVTRSIGRNLSLHLLTSPRS